MSVANDLDEYTPVREVYLVRSPQEKAEADVVIAEEPLEIFVESETGQRQVVATTMRTPGEDSYLALGYLFSEGIVKFASEVKRVSRMEGVQCSTSGERSLNQVVVHLTSETLPEGLTEHKRQGLQSSSCGLCGQTSIEHIYQSIYPDKKPSERIWRTEDVQQSLAAIKDCQPLFEQTGGSHGAWLLNADHSIAVSFEDIGRHNCLDKMLGYCLMHPETRNPDQTLIVSSRLSYELVHKAAILGVNVLGSVGAPSSLAVELAKILKITTLCFLNPHRFNIYTNPNFYFQF